jgi:hypothetical protein
METPSPHKEADGVLLLRQLTPSLALGALPQRMGSNGSALPNIVKIAARAHAELSDLPGQQMPSDLAAIQVRAVLDDDTMSDPHGALDCPFD